MRTSEQTEAIILGLTKALFGNQLQVQLVVLPPEDGTFLARLRPLIIVGGVIWAFLETDIGKGFITGLTDHDPAYWSEVIGRALKTSASEGSGSGADELASQRQSEAIIIREMATSFLRKDNADLVRSGVDTKQFREAFEAKNEFYRACTETPELRGIGFSESAHFPIRRSDFLRLQAVLPPRDDDVEQPWFIATAVLKVTSPNWDRDDRSRHWKGRDEQGRDRFFRIEDEEFWRRVSTDSISTHIIDVMKVQWAFQGSHEQPRNCRVLRVLEFNGSVLSSELRDDELATELYRQSTKSSGQWDLFRED